MPPRWVTFLLLAWLTLGVAIALVLRSHHHGSVSH
jgi:hypothetical protein